MQPNDSSEYFQTCSALYGLAPVTSCTIGIKKTGSEEAKGGSWQKVVSTEQCKP